MRHVKSSNAKTHLAELLDQVEAGETIVITRHGKPIARLSPEAAGAVEHRRRALDKLRSFRLASAKEPIGVSEIIEWRDEGRR